MKFDSVRYDNQLITKKYGRIKSVMQVYAHPMIKKKKGKGFKMVSLYPQNKFTVVKT